MEAAEDGSLSQGEIFSNEDMVSDSDHLPEGPYVGRWKVGVRNHWLEWELGAQVASLGQVEGGGGRERVLLA